MQVSTYLVILHSIFLFVMGLLYLIILYYIVRSEGMKMHAGVTLATECIQSFSNGSSRADSASLSSVQNIRRIGVGMGSDSSRFQVYICYIIKIHATCLFTLHLKLQLSMISRQSYKSTVTGMLSVSSNEKSQKRLLHGFCDGLFTFFFLSF